MPREDDAQTRPVGGTYTRIEGGYAFIPDPMPPRLVHTGDIDDDVINDKIQLAMMEIGRLDVTSSLIGGAFAHFMPYLAREAVASSMIEGTSTTINDLFRNRVLKDISDEEAKRIKLKEVDNNARALVETLGAVGKTEPISLDLIKRAHRMLFDGVETYPDKFMPGEFRTVQNHIGGKSVTDATYVPPPPDMVEPLMQNLVAYIESAKGPASSLVRCAVAHYQFEAIHPFPDGNGRVGRLLILLMMRRYGLLNTPVLNISRYLLRKRSTYYAMLRAPREHGGWAQWIAFFVDACKEQAQTGLSGMRQLDDLYHEYRERLDRVNRSSNAVVVVDALTENPYITIPIIQRITKLTHGGAADLVRRLVKANILTSVPTHSRIRLYAAFEILDILKSRDAEDEPDATRPAA